MKLALKAAIGAMVAVVAVTSAPAQHAGRTTTTVTKVHGPLKVLPHHDRKICKTRGVHHRRTRSCWYD